MEFDCTKPLGEALEKYLSTDLKEICLELSLHGIVYEGQYMKLGAMVCKKNAFELAGLFRKRTRKGISYGYENVSCAFFFYDMDKYTKEEAARLSVIFQDKMNISL